MLEFHVEARYEHSMAAVFAALVRELGAERWLQAGIAGPEVRLPRAGLRFGYRQRRRLYFGQVIECLRPVSIVLVERYQGPAGSILARQRWRVASLEPATRLCGHVHIETNRFARLQLRFWNAHFRGRAQRTCARVRERLTRSGAAHSGSIGHNRGNSSIVSANTTSVNGRPILR